MTEPIVEYKRTPSVKDKRNWNGLFMLLSAVVLAAGIFGGCYLIALSNRYMSLQKDYILYDKWTKNFYDADSGYKLYHLKDYPYLKGMPQPK